MQLVAQGLQLGAVDLSQAVLDREDPGDVLDRPADRRQPRLLGGVGGGTGAEGRLEEFLDHVALRLVDGPVEGSGPLVGRHELIDLDAQELMLAELFHRWADVDRRQELAAVHARLEEVVDLPPVSHDLGADGGSQPGGLELIDDARRQPARAQRALDQRDAFGGKHRVEARRVGAEERRRLGAQDLLDQEGVGFRVGPGFDILADFTLSGFAARGGVDQDQLADAALCGDRRKLDPRAEQVVPGGAGSHPRENLVVDGQVDAEGEQAGAQGVVELGVEPVLEELEVRGAIRPGTQSGASRKVMQHVLPRMIGEQGDALGVERRLAQVDHVFDAASALAWSGRMAL